MNDMACTTLMQKMRANITTKHRCENVHDSKISMSIVQCNRKFYQFNQTHLTQRQHT